MTNKTILKLFTFITFIFLIFNTNTTLEANSSGTFGDPTYEITITSSGQITTSGTYYIDSESGLIALSEYSNSSINTNGAGTVGYTFVIRNDIELSSGFRTISEVLNRSFKGTITSDLVNKPVITLNQLQNIVGASNFSGPSFIGDFSGSGVISNLSIVNLGNQYLATDGNIGGIVNLMYGSTSIINVSYINSGIIQTSGIRNNGGSTGGLVGRIPSSDGQIILSGINYVNRGTISGDMTGGLIGSAGANAQVTVNNINYINDGLIVSPIPPSTQYIQPTGGLIGKLQTTSEASITNINYEVTSSGTIKGPFDVGSIFGHLYQGADTNVRNISIEYNGVFTLGNNNVYNNTRQNQNAGFFAGRISNFSSFKTEMSNLVIDARNAQISIDVQMSGLQEDYSKSRIGGLVGWHQYSTGSITYRSYYLAFSDLSWLSLSGLNVIRQGYVFAAFSGTPNTQSGIVFIEDEMVELGMEYIGGSNVLAKNQGIIINLDTGNLIEYANRTTEDTGGYSPQFILEYLGSSGFTLSNGANNFLPSLLKYDLDTQTYFEDSTFLSNQPLIPLGYTPYTPGEFGDPSRFLTSSGMIVSSGNYYIDSVSGILALSEKVHNGSGLSDYTFVLTSGIDLADLMVPIGTTASPFYGTFRGSGIIPITFNEIRTTGSNNAAFFGVVGSGASISNLSVTISSGVVGHQAAGLISHIEGDSNSTVVNVSDIQLTIEEGANINSTSDIVAGFVGDSEKGHIHNITLVNNGTIRSTLTTSDTLGGRYIISGGIVGRFSTTTSNQLINTSYQAGPSSSIEGHVVGNLVAELDRALIQNNLAISSGVINGSSEVYYSGDAIDHKLGGMFGSIQRSTIRNNYGWFEGLKITGLNQNSSTGGVVGYVDSTLGVTTMEKNYLSLDSGLIPIESGIIGLFLGSERRDTGQHRSINQSGLVLIDSSLTYDYYGFKTTLEDIFTNPNSLSNAIISKDSGTVLTMADGTTVPSPNNQLSTTGILSYFSDDGFFDREGSDSYYPVLKEYDIDNSVYLSDISTPFVTQQTLRKLEWLEPEPVPTTPPTTPATTPPTTIQELIETFHIEVDLSNIILKIGEELEIPAFEAYRLFGYYQSGLNHLVTISDNVNVDEVGTYSIEYELSVFSTIKQEQITISEIVNVAVVDSIAPEIYGSKVITLFTNGDFIPDVYAIDNTDTNPTLTLLDQPDLSRASTQVILWQAEDMYGNISTFAQTITVVRPKIRTEIVRINNQQFVFVLREDEIDFDEIHIQYLPSAETSNDASMWQIFDESMNQEFVNSGYIRLSDGVNVTPLRQIVEIPEVIRTRLPVEYPLTDNPTSSSISWLLIPVVALIITGSTFGWWFFIAKRRRREDDEEKLN